jgi:hypothetical protein
MATKRTPAQVWKEIVADARDDEEIERLASMSDAALDEELAAAGLDPAKERAEAEAVVAELEHRVAARRAKQMEAEARARSLRPPSRRRPLAFWLAAAAVGTMAAGGLVYALTHPSAPPPAPHVPPVPSSAPTEVPPSQRLIAASELRKRAFAECAASHWDECLVRFDDARRLDPAGDSAPEVQAARDEAERQLQRKH